MVWDRRGNLWFGTYNGVSKYNGKRFHNITRADGLADDVVRAILEDRRGNIWIGTNKGGISRYNGETLTNFTATDGLIDDQITSILEDRDGAFEVFNHKDGLNNDNVVSIAFDDGGKLWMGTENGLCQMNTAEYEKTGRKIFKHFGKEEGIVGIECIHNSICKDRDGNIWVGTVMGAVKYNPQEL